MLDIKENDIIALSEDYSLYRVDLEDKKYWLFNVKNGRNFRLNEVSHFILTKCDSKTKLNEIKKDLMEIYSAGKSVITKDFDEFMDNCLAQGIVVKL